MLPMIAVREKLGTLLAADTSTLAPATNANKIALIVSPFALTENLTAGELTFGSTNGLTPIAGATGTQGSGLDPVTQQQVITILAPAGGWKWLSTSSFTGPITIYGYALVDTTLATLLAAQTLPTPIVISAAGYVLDLGAIDLTFVLNPIS